LNRPVGAEAAAGKNPVSHVGKIYFLLTHHMAREAVRRVEGLAEIYIWLCSQIGRPIDAPWAASSQVILQPGAELPDVQSAVEAVIQNIHEFSERLVRGELSVW
jgi:S-adenosylmethionine synthetase